MKMFVIVKTSFEGLHHWPEGHPDFLRNPHRHKFEVEAHIEVRHDNREIEIIGAKWLIDRIIKDGWSLIDGLLDLDETSCEQICTYIVNNLEQNYGRDRQYEVSVLEDGELGAKLRS